jgi:hypothetical protein
MAISLFTLSQKLLDSEVNLDLAWSYVRQRTFACVDRGGWADSRLAAKQNFESRGCGQLLICGVLQFSEVHHHRREIGRILNSVLEGQIPHLLTGCDKLRRLEK